MIRSMTGYGAAEAGLPDGRVLVVEVRTVNHRHLGCTVRLPQGWEELEHKVVERIRAALSRGRVSLSASCKDPERSAATTLELDVERLRRYASLLGEASREAGVEGRLDVNTLAALPGVFRVAKPPTAAPDGAEFRALACVGEALDRAVEMREAEGRMLEGALRESLKRIAAEVDAVEARAPERLLRERDRLRERVRLLAESVDVDEDRLAREVAYLAEKWDVTEEVVRLRSHVALFLETLDGAAAQAGKRLGFVVQEMNREANTIGSKANDAAISASAVAVKEELERIREQLENVE